MAKIQEIARQAALTKARELIGEDLVDEREVCALANAVAAAVQAVAYYQGVSAALAVMSASHEGERKAWSHKRQEQAAEIERLTKELAEERHDAEQEFVVTGKIIERAERAEAEIQRLRADLADALARRP